LKELYEMSPCRNNILKLTKVILIIREL
jgi:hypothetical protein